MKNRILMVIALITASVSAQAQNTSTSAMTRILVSATKAQPDDANTLRLLAQDYARNGHYDQARKTLLKAQGLAPRDNDIRLARAHVELWSGHLAEAKRLASEVAVIEPANSELSDLTHAITIASMAERRPVSINFSQSIADVRFTGGRRTWYESTGSIDVPIGKKTNLTAEVDREDRGASIDTRLGARIDHRLGDGSLYIAAAATPNASFRERWSIEGGGEYRIGRQIYATLGARHADYGISKTDSLNPGVRVETANHRNSASLHSINLWNEQSHQSGWSGRVDTSPSDKFQLFAGAATYPDTEAGVTRRVKALYAGSIIMLSDRMIMRLTADREQRAQSYRRTGVAIGLGWKFGP